MKAFILFSALITFVTIGFSQSQEIDSLEMELNRAQNDTTKVLLMGELAWKYLGISPEKSKSYATDGLVLAKKLDFKNGEVMMLNYLGEYNFRGGEFAKGIDYVTRALNVATTNKDTLGLAQANRLLGLINNFGLKQYDLSILYNLKALEYYQVKKDMPRVAVLYSNIAWLYANTNQKLDEARVYADLAMEIAIETNDIQLQGWVYNSIGLINYKEEKLDSAIYYLEISNVMNLDVGDRAVVSYNNSVIGSILLDMEDNEGAIAKFQQSVEDGRAMNTKEVIKDSYLGLSKGYARLNRFKEAMRYRLLHDQLKDSLVSWEITQKMAILKHEQDIEREASQIALLEKERQVSKANQRTYIISLLVGILSLIVVLALVLRSSKQRTKSFKALEEKNLEIASNNSHLQEVVNTRDKLFSIIGHDLRGPIVSVKSVLDLVGQSAISPRELKEIMPQLTQNVGRVYETLENLLEWSHSQLKGIKSCPKLVNINEAINSTVSLFSELANSKKIVVVINIPSSTMVMADVNQVNIIFRNLLNNAIKFTPNQGRVKISAKSNSRYVEICIKDSGVGMSSTQIKEIFNDGLNASTQGTSGEKGTGIGLLLVKEMIDSNLGKIEISSQEGVGSEFKVYLLNANTDKNNSS